MYYLIYDNNIWYSGHIITDQKSLQYTPFELATYANGQTEAPQKQMLFFEQMACLSAGIVENNCFELCKEQ